MLTSLRFPHHAFLIVRFNHLHVVLLQLEMDGGLLGAARDAVILHILRYGFLDLVLLPDLHLAEIR